MKLATLAAFASFVFLRAMGAAACSCSGQGPASALTRRDETWGLRSSERMLFGYGAFNAHGKYAPFAPSEHDRTVEYALLAAYRRERLELSATLGYGSREVDIAGEFGRSMGFGDAAFRARFELVDEPEPWRGAPPYPSLALLASITAPTGTATGIAPRGLGAAEFAFGVSLERSFAQVLRAGLVLQVAERLSDTSLGLARELGPRATAEGTLSFFASPTLVLSALISIRWEGNVSLDGHPQSGTAQRTSELGGALSWQPWSSPIRAGFSERYAPGMNALGANTVQSATTEIWLGYVR